MAGWVYKSVPFYAQVKTGFFSSENAGVIAAQLDAVIEQYASQGWEFYQFGDVDVNVQPGCLASLLGAKAANISYDILIFRAPRP